MACPNQLIQFQIFSKAELKLPQYSDLCILFNQKLMYPEISNSHAQI